MKKYILLSFALGAFLFQSCGETKKNENGDSSINRDTVAVNEEHHHEDEAIVLNNGQKWKVDDSMMVHIRNIEKEVNDFASQKGTDYGKLATSLQNHLDLLTSNCTMTGQAHDELHKWLLPFIDMVDALANADSSQAAEKFADVKKSFDAFNTYFE